MKNSQGGYTTALLLLIIVIILGIGAFYYQHKFAAGEAQKDSSSLPVTQ